MKTIPKYFGSVIDFFQEYKEAYYKHSFTSQEKRLITEGNILIVLISVIAEV